MSTEQDIKTEEQIPLTYAAVAAPTVQTEGEAVVAPEEPKPKKNWFTFGKKKAAPTDETNIEEGGAPGDEPVKEKKEKKCWWSRCQKGEGEQKVRFNIFEAFICYCYFCTLMEKFSV